MYRRFVFHQFIVAAYPFISRLVKNIGHGGRLTDAVVELFPMVGRRLGCGFTTFERIVLWIIVHLWHHRTIVSRRIDGNIGLALGVKLDRWYIIEKSYRLSHSRKQDLEDGLFVLKLDFSLGGMDVDINILRLHFEVNKIRHLLTLRHQSLEGVHHGLVKIRMPHVAIIDEEILMRSFFLRRFGLADKTTQLTHRRLHAQRQQVLIDTLAKNIHDSLFQSSRTEVKQFRSIAV